MYILSMIVILLVGIGIGYWIHKTTVFQGENIIEIHSLPGLYHSGIIYEQSRLTEKDMISGGIYRMKGDIDYIVSLVQTPKGRWCLLALRNSDIHGMTMPFFIFDENKDIGFTDQELIEKWDFKSWTLLDGRLRFEKINDKQIASPVLGGDLTYYRFT